MKPSENPKLRTNRSFVIREGRFTSGQKKALSELWPKYGIPHDNIDKIVPNDWFTDAQPIILDIGFGSGDSLISLAKQRTDYNFIGIEVYRPGIGSVLQKIDKQEVDNIRVINADVLPLLKTQFDKELLSGVMVWFPDPWPKTKHHKRRLIQQEFLTELVRVMKHDSILHLASDWQPYVQFMRKHVAQVNSLCPIHSNINPLGLNRPHTRFEQRGLSKGHEVSDLIYSIKK